MPDYIALLTCIVGESALPLLPGLSTDYFGIASKVIPDRNKPGKEIKAVRRRREIVNRLHVEVEPQVFQPGSVVFDGKASLFTSRDLGFATRMVYPLPTIHVRIVLMQILC